MRTSRWIALTHDIIERKCALLNAEGALDYVSPGLTAQTHKSDSRFCVKVLLDPTAEQKQTLTRLTLSEIMAPLIHTFGVQ